MSQISIDSGHGGQTKDLNGDEIDGYDEGLKQGSPSIRPCADTSLVIFPLDFARAGHILDDVSVPSFASLIHSS
jgi:hypothetical protein